MTSGEGAGTNGGSSATPLAKTMGAASHSDAKEAKGMVSNRLKRVSAPVKDPEHVKLNKTFERTTLDMCELESPTYRATHAPTPLRTHQQWREIAQDLHLHDLVRKAEGLKVEDPEQDPRNTKIRQLLSNLWLLGIMVGILVLVVVSKDRTHEPEMGHGWQSMSGARPFMVRLHGNKVVDVVVTVMLPPYEFQARSRSGALAHEAAKGNRRRQLLGGVELDLDSLLAASNPLEAVAAAQRRQQREQRAAAVGAGARAAGGALLRAVSGFGGRRLLAGQEAAQGGGDAMEAAGEGHEGEGHVVSHVLPHVEFSLVQQLRRADGTNGDLITLKGPKSCTFNEVMAVDCHFEWKHVSRVVPENPLVVMGELKGLEDPLTGMAIYVEAVQLGAFGAAKEWVALTIMALMLVLIATEVVHRMWAAFLASFAMVSLLLLENATPDLAKVVSWFDFGTLGLLWGMMVIVGHLKNTGVFEVICAWCLRLSKGNVMWLTVLLCFITAFVSAWLDNVTTMLLMAPMTISVFKIMNRDPRALLVAQAIMSNVGGTATMVGDPPNIIIGNRLRQHVGFIDFLTELAPGILVAVPITMVAIILNDRKSLTGRMDNYEAVMSKANEYKIRDWRLFSRCMYVTGIVVLAFLLHPIHHLNPAWPAIIGATVLCLAVDPQEVHVIIVDVEWDVLMFFAAMFVTVEAAAELGLIRKIASLLKLIINTSPDGKRLIAAIEVMMWFSAIFSAILDNIPYTITLLPVIQDLATTGLDLKILAWALSFGACLGGNGTLIGASANIVTAGIANKAGLDISFKYWLRPGIVATIVSVAVANVYMLLRYGL